MDDQTTSTLVISKVEKPAVEEDEVGDEAEEHRVVVSEKIYDIKFSSTI